MLTKTLRFDDDVIGVIRSMEWRDNGTIGIITGGQLERKLYEKVNKALDAMGGKWNRKAGGHTFQTDPRPMVEGLLENGALTVEKDGYFQTPRSVVLRMMELAPLDLDGYCLEPSAGCGAIADVLVEYGMERDRIACVEKNEQRAAVLTAKGFPVECCDFLQFTEYGFPRVYMNPPFEEGQDINHVRHAFDLLEDGGALVSVMGEGAFFRDDRKSNEFREWLGMMEAEVEKLPDKSFHESGTDVATRLVVIRK